MAEYLILTNADDGEQDNTVWDDTPSSWVADTAKFSGTPADNDRFGMRFGNIAVSPGATIVSATLDIYVERIYREPRMIAHGVDADNPAQFSSSNLPTNNTLTTASGEYNFSGEGSATNYTVLNERKVIDVTAIVQEIVDRGGWASGNAMSFILSTNYSENLTNWMYCYDSNAGATYEPKLNISTSSLPGISDVDGDNVIISDQTGVVITGVNLTNVTEVRLKFGGAVSTITPSATTASTVTFDVTQGDVPFGAITCEIYDGTNTDSLSITLLEPATSDYVACVNPVTSPASVFFNATHTPLTGDQIEYTEPSDVTVFADGTFSIANGSTITSFDVRTWRSDIEQWEPWVTLQVGGDVNTPPVVTAPDDIEITFPYGSGGLAQSDTTLTAWGQSATVTDDIDTLEASADFTAFGDPIPAGYYNVTFTSDPDSGGLTGSDTALLTVTEGQAANQAPIVTPPADLSIEFAFGSGGLAKTDSALVTWLASATYTDDRDSDLTVSGSVAALSDPIPAGTHAITFSCTDNDGLTGTASANLIVSEAEAPNQAPTVTAPANVTLEFPNGAVGLDKNDSALLAWIATATVTDDNDTLTVSADLSVLADPIPAGTYEITFTSSADSGGLVGTDSAFLTVVEAAALSPDVVYDSGFRVVKIGGNKHTAKIYNGKQNRIRLELLNNGVSYSDLTLTTRAVFNLYFGGSVLTLDSDLNAAAFDWSIGSGLIDMEPSALSIVDGTVYQGELIIYNASHSSGVVFVDRDKFKVEGA